MGQIIFKSDARRAKAAPKFALVGDGMQAEHVCDLLEQDWNLKRPSVLLSVTGSAQDLRRPARRRAILKTWPGGRGALNLGVGYLGRDGLGRDGASPVTRCAMLAAMALRNEDARRALASRRGAR